MIRKLRLKFVTICMTLVTAVLAAVFLSVYISMQQSIEALSVQVLYQVMHEDAYSDRYNHFSLPGITDPVLLPYFTVQIWGNSAYVTGGTYANLEDTEELKDILDECLSKPEEEGVLSRYHLRYLRQDNGMYLKIAFVDMSMEMRMLRSVLRPYALIALGALVLLLAISCLLSYWAVRPVERAWQQQRQFLSDASHELKTPLTVILSNAELLESAPLEDRPARWADNIHSEAQQMKSLVEEMLTLARADNMTRQPILSAVSLSDLAADCALAFEAVAFEAGKTLEYDITQNLVVSGDQEKLRQLISILLDNAIKYGAEGGVIRLSLQKADRQARLQVSNPGKPIPPQQLPHLFERFYRADVSRGEKAGFGLGLAIAKTIADQHHAALRAESDADSTRFFFQINLLKSKP